MSNQNILQRKKVVSTKLSSEEVDTQKNSPPKSKITFITILKKCGSVKRPLNLKDICSLRVPKKALIKNSLPSKDKRAKTTRFFLRVIEEFLPCLISPNLEVIQKLWWEMRSLTNIR